MTTTEAAPTASVDIAGDFPEGWLLTPLGDVCSVNPPKAPKDALSPSDFVTFVPMPALNADAGAITAPERREFSAIRSGYTSFREGDVIFAKITPCMENGKTAIARQLENGLGFGSTEFHVLRPTDAVLAEYIYYFVRQEAFRRIAEAEMTGSVGQKRVPADFMKAADIPIPPLAEQQRIVAKVEALLAQVDAARERLARVPALLKGFRQSVLSAACLGRLNTSASLDDQSEELQLPRGWRWCQLDEVLERVEAGKNFTCAERPPSEDEVGLVKISAVTWGEFRQDESKTCTDPSKVETRYFIKPGDFLFSRANTIELVGACVLAENVTRNLMISDKVLRFHFKGVSPSWILYVLRSPHGRNEIQGLATGNQASMRNISQGNIRRIRVPMPPRFEQDEIVGRVDTLLAFADAVDESVRAATERAVRLTQSILARAFRGELVPTEAELARQEGREYEPASVLLERISSEVAPP